MAQFLYEIMSTELLTVDWNAKVSEAHELMIKHNVRHLVVLQNGNPEGILSDRNISVAVYVSILNSAARRENVTIVGDLCTRCPVTLPPEASILEAAKIIRDRKISAIPVMENKVLKGIVTTHDLMMILVELLSPPKK